MLFKGCDFVSDSIRFLGIAQLDNDFADDYSHVGLVVTRDILNDDRLEEDKIYVWESTISGKLGKNIYNIGGKAFLGVQLTDFDDVSKREKLKQDFTQIFNQYNVTRYDSNFCSLFSAIYTMLRCLRGVDQDKDIPVGFLINPIVIVSDLHYRRHFENKQLMANIDIKKEDGADD